MNTPFNFLTIYCLVSAALIVMALVILVRKNRLRQLRQFLCCEIECDVLEKHVLPALDKFDLIIANQNKGR